MTDFAEEYKNLSRRREGLVSQIAVRRAEEERKTKEREEIEAELKAAGVDPTKPDEEIQRLTQELEADRAKISKELDEVENLLNAKVSQPEQQSTTNPAEILREAAVATAEQAGLEVDHQSFDEAAEQLEEADPSALDIIID